ncbi:hypothetical protein Btru_072614 [Bulinus truncatus]|nr:hypothetical protein Btru_072614 [Bulinus truncatus]
MKERPSQMAQICGGNQATLFPPQAIPEREREAARETVKRSVSLQNNDYQARVELNPAGVNADDIHGGVGLSRGLRGHAAVDTGAGQQRRLDVRTDSVRGKGGAGHRSLHPLNIQRAGLGVGQISGRELVTRLSVIDEPEWRPHYRLMLIIPVLLISLPVLFGLHRIAVDDAVSCPLKTRHCYMTFTLPYLILSFTVSFYVPIFAMVILYLAIFLKLQKICKNFHDLKKSDFPIRMFSPNRA